MAFLHITANEHLSVIKRRLRSRLLRPILDMDDKGVTEWEIHGPCRDMNYQVYIGPVLDRDDRDFLVAMYPRAVYDVGDKDWLSVTAEDRIPVIMVGLRPVEGHE